MAVTAPENINDYFKLVDLRWVKAFNLPIVFVLGGPGAGKATICHQFLACFGVSYFSMGQLLRHEANHPTSRGREIAKYVHQQPCQKVPLDLVMSVLKDVLVRVVAARRPIFIQGFPRDLAQAVRYEQEIAIIKYVIYIKCSEQTAVRRLIHRNKHADRFEDDVGIVKLRRTTFVTEVLPVIENLHKADRVVQIDGNNNRGEAFEQAVCYYLKWLKQLKAKNTLLQEKVQKEKVKEKEKDVVLQATGIPINPTSAVTGNKVFPSIHYFDPA